MIGSDRTWNYRNSLEKRNKRLYKEMLRPGALKPRLTISMIMAFAVALIIHGITLYFVWAFLWNLANAFLGFQRHQEATIGGSLIAAAVSLIIAWLLRPKLGRWPKNVLDNAEFPELYSLANRVADELHTRRVDGIRISYDYNASYGRVGIKQRPLITIGLPVWAALNDQERVALIAHEVAHSANGDFTRGFILGSAYTAAVGWHNFAISLITVQKGAFIINLIVLPVWIIASLLLSVLRRLLLHESRRAEYLADKLAADVGGTEAALSVLIKLQFSKNYQSYVKNAAHGTPLADVFARFQRHMVAILSNPKELEKLESDKAIVDAHYNFTHPPTALRRAFLEHLPKAQPSITLSSYEAADLTREVDTLTKNLTISQR